MEKDEPIGGFIGLEVQPEKGIYHSDAIALSNGRACFNFILKQYKPSKVYIPFYTCLSIIKPLVTNNIPYQYYSIDNNLAPLFNGDLKANAFFLYINYYDIKNDVVEYLENRFGDKLIVDNTQAFFKKKYAKALSFNSCRKFFGVPDGGYLYVHEEVKDSFIENTNYIYDHLINRIARNDDTAYKQFLENNKNQTIDVLGMSAFSKKIMMQIDYDYNHKRRIENFNYLHSFLSTYNELAINVDHVGTPLYYPFYSNVVISKKALAEEKIFIPTLWPHLLVSNLPEFEWEQLLAKNTLPLPIDQRYSKEEMITVIQKIKKHLQNGK